MNTEPDYGDDIRRLHEHLDRGHEQLRDGLMQKLRKAGVIGRERATGLTTPKDSSGQSGDIVLEVVKASVDVPAEPVAGVASSRDEAAAELRRFTTPQKLVAIALLTLVATMVLRSVTSRPAYALRSALKSVAQADSFYVRGHRYTAFQQQKLPVEAYVDRGGRMWVVRKNNVRSPVDQTSRVVDVIWSTNGEVRRQFKDDPGYDVDLPYVEDLVARDIPAWAKIEAATQASNVLSRGFLFTDAAGFSSVGTELVDDVDCHVFERAIGLSGSRHRFYVSIDERKPVRAMQFVADADGAIESIVWMIDEVVLNPVSIPQHISFRPEADIEVAPLPTTRTRFAHSDKMLSPRMLSVPFALQLDGGLLVGYSERPMEKKEAELLPMDSEVNFTLLDNDDDVLATDVVTLGETRDIEATWTWVLLQPQQRDAEYGGYLQVSCLIPEVRAMGKDPSVWRMPSVALDDDSIREVLSQMSTASGDVSLDGIRTLIGN